VIGRRLSEIIGYAVNEAQKRRHEYVNVEHILYAVLHDPLGGDIIRGCGGGVKNLKAAVEIFFDRRLERLPEECDYRLEQTNGFRRVIQRTVNHVRSAEKQEAEVGDILASILLEKESHSVYFLNREGIARLDVLSYISSDIRYGFHEIPGSGRGRSDGETKKEGEVDFLEAFTSELVEEARLNNFDPVICREAELERTVQVLCRRRKNNPIYVGEPGVGKTSLAEGLAIMIASGKIPKILSDIKIYSLDMGALLAGTRFRADFEKRLKGIFADL